MKTLIKNGKLFNSAGINGEICDILIADDIIAGIAPSEKGGPDSQADLVVDASDKIITPGLIDAHCHIGLMENTIGWAGDDVNEMSSPVTPELRGIDSVKPNDTAFECALKAGVTTVSTGPGSANVIGGTFCILKTAGKTVAEKTLVTESAMKMALGENPKRVYGKGRNTLPGSRMGSAAVMRDWLYRAKEYKAKTDAYDALSEKEKKNKTKPPFDFKLDSLKRVFEGLPVKIHAHQEDDIETAIRICREFGLKDVSLDHCTAGWLIPETVKESGFSAILGPSMTGSTKYEVKNRTFKAAKVMKENGILFAIMSDHYVVDISMTTTQLSLFVKAGLDYVSALEAVTINPAKILHIDDTLGSLEPGKKADVVIWNGDPLHYMSSPVQVYVDGIPRI